MSPRRLHRATILSMVTTSVGMPSPYDLRALPIYEYRCENGHLFEVMQKITEAPLTECNECGAPVVKVLHSPAVHFKGSGFYNTDYGTSKRKRELDKSASDGADKNDAKQKEKRESKTDSKPAAKSD